MQCPKCNADMEVIEYNGVHIDRCTGCQGIFFDHLEQDILKRLKGAESVDTGDEFMGAKYNEITDINCPRCGAPMNHVREERPCEIGFESCPECRGAFFDAGEFRDYMEDELFEQFQDFVQALE